MFFQPFQPLTTFATLFIYSIHSRQFHYSISFVDYVILIRFTYFKNHSNIFYNNLQLFRCFKLSTHLNSSLDLFVFFRLLFLVSIFTNFLYHKFWNHMLFQRQQCNDKYFTQNFVYNDLFFTSLFNFLKIKILLQF